MGLQNSVQSHTQYELHSSHWPSSIVQSGNNNLHEFLSLPETKSDRMLKEIKKFVTWLKNE